MQHYDAVVVGAGIGGLCAAGILAKRGKKVAVLEKNHTPGGVANSFRRGRFEFEISLHELCGFGPDDRPFGSARRVLDALGLSHRIDWVRVPEAYRLLTFEGENPIDARLPFGIEAFTDAMERYVPGCRGAVSDAFLLAAEIRAALAALGAARTTEEKAAVLSAHSDFLHIAGMSVEEGLAALGLPPRAADLMKGYWAYLFTDCTELSFLHYLNMFNSYIELGSVIPRNRSLALSLEIADLIRENGSDVFLNAEVMRIGTENGRAASVTIADGTVISADDVICDISPAVVFGSLLPPEVISSADRRKTNARELSGRGFCVYLGLNRSAEALGLTDYSYFIYPDMDTAAQYRAAAAPETNFIQNTVCQNAADPGASPSGTCMLTMTTLFSSDCWGNVSDADYQKEKEAFAAQMIVTFERAVGVSIRPYIEEIEIAAPQTFARFIGSPEGAIYGYRAAEWDSILARKMMDAHFSQLDRLHFCGGFGMNLNGYSSAMGSGMDTANRILNREAKK